MKTLRQNLNNAYIRAMNKLGGKHARRRIVVYVESYDDVNFWRQLLAPLETERTCFEVLLPSHTTLCKGKKTALANELGERLGQYMIACVDADYDYLMQGATDTSRTICQSPYVFHTYTYAIENHQCYAPSLQQVCVMASLNDRRLFDFEHFLSDYSRTIWPLFAWNVWAYRRGYHAQFSLLDFAHIVALDHLDLYHPERSLEALRRRVNTKVSKLQRQFPQGRSTYKPLQADLQRLGVTPETTYLFMRGHDLMDGVVVPLLTMVCDTLRREREREIQRLAEHALQLQNELSAYQHASASIPEMLRKHNGFTEAPLYKRIQSEVAAFLQRNATSPTP